MTMEGLYEAVFLGEVERVKRLLSLGADVNAPHLSVTSPTDPEVSSMSGRSSMYSRYLSPNGSPPLRMALMNEFVPPEKRLQIVQLLLSKGARVNAADKLGQTALHIAAVKNDRGIAELLIDRGANIEVKHREGLTPLHEAARANGKDVVQLLLQKGADANARDKNGTTPLALAERSDGIQLGGGWRVGMDTGDVVQLIKRYGGTR